MKKYLIIGIVLLTLTGCKNSKEVELCKALKEDLSSTQTNLRSAVEVEIGNSKIKNPELVDEEIEKAKKYLNSYYNDYCTNKDYKICEDMKTTMTSSDNWNNSLIGEAGFEADLTVLEIDCAHVLGED